LPADDRSYRPRWLRFAPFLGRPPALTRRQWSVLGLVSIVSLFEQYDVYLFSLLRRYSRRRSSWCGATGVASARSRSQSSRSRC
jgi:hypothetical protein